MEVSVRMGWCSSNRRMRTKRIPRKSSRKYDEFNCKQNLKFRRKQVVISPVLHLRKRRKKAVVVGACPYNLRPATAITPALASDDSCVILSDSEDEGFDKGPEARKQKYAIMAVDSYNKDRSDKVELVETGPLAVGYIPTGRILHFNFKAKLKHDPHAPVLTFSPGTNFEVVKEGPLGQRKSPLGFIKHINFEAKNKTDPGFPVQTFFAQLIRNRLFLFTDFCKCLGPSDCLPDKVDYHGCTICRSNHVHHPPGSGYLTGQSDD